MSAECLWLRVGQRAPSLLPPDLTVTSSRSSEKTASVAQADGSLYAESQGVTIPQFLF